MLTAYSPEGWSPVPHAVTRAPDLSVYAKVVYAVLNSHIFPGHECIEMTEAQIAEEANCSWSQAHRAIAELAGDWLEINQRPGRKSCYVISNIYRPTPVSQRGVIGVPLSAREDTPVSQTAHPLPAERGSGTKSGTLKKVTILNNNTDPPTRGGWGTKSGGITASKYQPGGQLHHLICNDAECIRKGHQP